MNAYSVTVGRDLIVVQLLWRGAGTDGESTTSEIQVGSAVARTNANTESFLRLP
jgi:hypothetical protein